ncbi:vWA domain-containing protein [Streptomyces sp. SID3343]|uniref:vWA domain-containing protein n=1 Tax=Streptomyces sp. SID3343 TaxID=2690260 RepID=UPI00136F23F3|nr:vWA domain-containing protein [Streptomyces sp. SID3343]
MRTRRRALLTVPGVVALIMLLCGATIPPAAAPSHAPPSGRSDADTDAEEQLLNLLHANDAPADYYVVLDVSTSMLDNGGYDDAKTALRDFLNAAPANDRVALIRFGETTALAGAMTPVPKGDREIARYLAALPAPTDQASDFGGAMKEVSRIIANSRRPTSGYLPPTTVLVLTDAELFAPDNPEYADAKSPGWARVRDDFENLRKERGPITAYALPLGDNARGINLLAQVLPLAEVLSGSVEEQGERLRERKQRARERKAAALVRADDGASVTATLGVAPDHPPSRPPSADDCARAERPAPDTRVDLSAATVLCLELRSTAAHIRTGVENLSLRADTTGAGDSPDCVLPRETVVVDPGVPVRIPITCRARDRRRTDLGGDSAHYSGSVTLSGDVTSPDAADFARWLDVRDTRVAPTLVGAELRYTGLARGSIDWARWRRLAAWAVLALLLCAASVQSGRRLPRNAHVELRLDIARVAIRVRWPHHLRGVRHTWIYGDSSPTGAVARLTVRGRWGRGGRRIVVICRYRQDTTRRRTVRRLKVGEITMLDGIRARVTRDAPPQGPTGPGPGDDIRPPDQAPPNSRNDSRITPKGSGKQTETEPVEGPITPPPPVG